jgi:hypothetical protein
MLRSLFFEKERIRSWGQELGRNPGDSSTFKVKGMFKMVGVITNLKAAESQARGLWLSIGPGIRDVTNDLGKV